MNISKIQTTPNFYNTQKPQKREFIDIISDNVRNSLFKAYIYLMAGSGLISIANFLPQKWKGIKTSLNVLGAGLGIISAVYFAKPFAVKSLSPTVKKEELNKNENK